MGQPIQYRQVADPSEVQLILDLQAANHRSNLADNVAVSQGFVTVRHDPEVLLRMNRKYPSVIAKDGPVLAGYCLIMLREFGAKVPELAMMFALLDRLSWHGRPLKNLRWFVMGQICVAADYRGSGVFDDMYQKLREVCQKDFDVIITEVAERNERSLRAHRRVGFETIHTYPDDTTGEIWHVIALAC